MSKRFANIFFISLGAMLFLTVGFFLVLFLAPGFSAFGLRYIAIDTRAYDSKEVIIMDQIGSFSGSIVIECEDAPIKVQFTQGPVHTVRYYENFSGLTTTKIENPALSVKMGKDGSAVIKVESFKKYIFQNSNTERYLVLSVPLTSVAIEDESRRPSLTINSKNSDISFANNFEGEDLRIPEFNTVKIATNGNIQYDTHVKATTYNLKTNDSIVINEAKTIAVDATNYILESVKGQVSVQKPVVGNLDITVYNTGIKLVSCANLKARAGFGDITCYKKDAKIQVSGIVDISTKAGSVVLGDVLGVGANKISTGSGYVSIDKILDGKITTKSGNVTVTSVNNVEIETNMGKVAVEEALSALKVTTKRSKVVLGGEGMIMNNVTAFSRIGDITLLSATGKVNVQTVSSDISITNSNSEDMTVDCGGKLVATGLKGLVNIKVAKDCSLKFVTISDDAKIEAGDGCNKVKIEALSNSVKDTQLILSGKKVVRWEENEAGSSIFSKIEETTDLVNGLNGMEPLLKFAGKNAVVDLYLKSAPIE